MFFNRVTKPIKLKFYSNHASAHELFKPDRASAFMPSWMSGSDSRVKHCYGLRSSFYDGFGIPLWSDLSIQLKETAPGKFDGRYDFADQSGLSKIKFENDSSPMHPRSKMLFKLSSVWMCECDEDIKFSAMENMWSSPNRKVEFVSGVLDFRFQFATNMFFYVEKKNQNLVIEAGDVPLLFRQLSERKLKIECHYDPEKYSYLDAKAHQIPFFSQNHMKIRNMLLHGKKG